MKQNTLFRFAKGYSIIMLLLFCLSCSKDEAPATSSPPPPPPPPPPPTCASCQLLYYGGDNVDAPTLEAGSYEAAARFTPAKIGNLAGKTIKEIRFFIAERPDSIKVKLYGPLNATTPGALLYSADVTSVAEPIKWNIHTLTNAIVLKDEDIWLSIGFKFSGGSRRTIGCDPGPAVTDGDWLYNSMDLAWTPFHKRTPTSINWTIRLNVAL